MALQFSENRQRSLGLSVTSNPRTVLSSVGLQEATEAEAITGAVQNRFISPLRLTQKLTDAGFGLGNVTGPASSVDGNVAVFSGTSGELIDDSGVSLAFAEPSQFPINITSGHKLVYADSDAQFGNAYSNYPLGVVSPYPTVHGKAGSSIGSSTPGQTFSISFTSTGLTGSPITITYTAVGGDTTATIAAALCAAINAHPTLHDVIHGQPIFAQSFTGSATFNLQYTWPFSAIGATPLTTTSVGTGTINLPAASSVLDFTVLQLGRNVPGRDGTAGDDLFGIDVTGQDATGLFNLHYGQITVSISDPAAGAPRGLMRFMTAGGAEGYFDKGFAAYDTSGVVAAGGSKGLGTFNIPGPYYLNNLAFGPGYNWPGALFVVGQSVLPATGVGLRILSDGAATTEMRAFNAATSALVTNLIVGSEVQIQGAAGTLLRFGSSVLFPHVNDGYTLGTSSLGFSDLFLASGAVINFANSDVTITHAANQLHFQGGGYFFDGQLSPLSNDGAALGSTSNQWSDLFFAAGAVVNFDSGDLTLTHAADQITVTIDSVNKLRVDKSATATHTALLVWDVDNAALERVTVGVADSGGAGFKVLRIPN